MFQDQRDTATGLEALPRERQVEDAHSRVAAEALLRCLSATLDEVDYGIVLVADTGRTVHANHAARAELDDEHPLQIVDGALRTRRPHDRVALADALAGASGRGLRRLLTLGEGTHRVGIAVVPLLAAGEASQGVTLLMLGKVQLCEELSIEAYARAHQLTPAETRVLVALAKGLRPEAAARALGVAISTVRTQTSMIRMKTGVESIGAVLRQVSVLPPLMTTLRRSGGAPPAREFRPAA